MSDHKPQDRTGNKFLVLGIGNEILTDDGIGPRLVTELEKLEVPGFIHFLTAATGGMDIMELICSYERVIIIDALKSGKDSPGTVYHYTPDDFRESLHVSSFHDISFLTALKLAEKLEMHLPEKIDIIAVEIEEDLTFSNEFSPRVNEKYPEVLHEVIAIFRKLIEPYAHGTVNP